MKNLFGLFNRQPTYVNSGDKALAYLKTELAQTQELTRESESKLTKKAQRKFGLSEGMCAELLRSALEEGRST